MKKKQDSVPDETPEVSAKVEATKEDSSTPQPRAVKKTRWFRATVIILFGIVYAWDLFAALSNFVGKLEDLGRMNEVRELNSYTLIETPWVPLIANLALPVVVFALALWISRRRNIGVLSIILFAGLGVVAAVSLSLIVYVRSLF